VTSWRSREKRAALAESGKGFFEYDEAGNPKK